MLSHNVHDTSVENTLTLNYADSEGDERYPITVIPRGIFYTPRCGSRPPVEVHKTYGCPTSPDSLCAATAGGLWRFTLFRLTPVTGNEFRD